MTDLAKVDLAAAAENLKEQIRMGFAALLTEEQLKALIKEEIVRFTSKDGGLSRMIHEEFRKVVAEQLKDFGATKWGHDENGVWCQSPSLYVSEWLRDNSDQVIKSVIANMLGNAVSEVLQRASQYR